MTVGLALRRIAAASALAIVTSSAAHAQDKRAFDGTWLVLFSCIAAPDGAAGYTLKYLASVQDGLLHGENGVRGREGSLSLDGPIMPDGSAVLLATGLTADSRYNVGRAPPMSAVNYHIQARFQATRGTGKRMELRSCEAVFTKQ